VLRASVVSIVSVLPATDQTCVDSVIRPSISCFVTIVRREPSHLSVDIESAGWPPGPVSMLRLSVPSSL